MPSLSEMQRAFTVAMLGGDPLPAAATVVPDGLAPDARLAIYRHHVVASLTGVLAEVYPVVRRLVDPRFFEYAADAFIRRHPPADPCLVEYGADLAGFLTEFPAVESLPYLADVARLEWALHHAAHAPAVPLLDISALASLRPDTLPAVRLRLHPAVTLIASRYPIDRIWRANQPGGAAEALVDLDAGPAYLMVHRRYGDAVWEPLLPAVFELRAALVRGETLGRAAEAAFALDPRLDLAAALRDLFTTFIREITS